MERLPSSRRANCPRCLLPEGRMSGSPLCLTSLCSGKIWKPGKTATINFYDVDGVDLVDLPGYGYAQVSKSELERWSDLIEGYFNDERFFALVVSLIDIRHDPSELDRNMVEFLLESELPFAIALTKADKLSKQKANSQKQKIMKQLMLPKNTPVVMTSSEKGTGIDELRALITSYVQ